jgi:F0F1-type ATP synthase assembly protein I
MESEEKKRAKLDKRIKRFRSSENNSDVSPLKGFGLMGSIGFTMAGSLGICIFVGNYLDQKWHTKPWLTLLGIAAGLVFGGFGCIEVIRMFLGGKGL